MKTKENKPAGGLNSQNPPMCKGHVIQYNMMVFTRSSLAVNLHTFVILMIMP